MLKTCIEHANVVITFDSEKVVNGICPLCLRVARDDKIITTKESLLSLSQQIINEISTFQGIEPK